MGGEASKGGKVIYVRRSALMALFLAAVSLTLPTWAIGQTTTGPAPGTPTAPTPTVRVNTGPPEITALRLRTTITAQQGHARFMVGLKSKTPVTVTVKITSVKTKSVVRTVRSTAHHPQGPIWFLVQAVNEDGYQLPTGKYTVVVSAKDRKGRTPTDLKGAFTLTLTPPRGRLDGYTVPNLPAIARQLMIAPGGQLVTALAPKGALVTAGLRRGDVITALNGLDVTSLGQWVAALKALPADTPVTVAYRRGAEVRSGTIVVPADWNPTPDYAKVFRVLITRNPMTLGYLVASTRDRLDAGDPDQAQTQFDAWPPARAKTAVGQMVQGEILLAKADLPGALAAYTRATTTDPTLAPALLGRGLVLSRLDRTAEAVPVFQAAVAMDPGSAIAQAFLAYALIATAQYDLAITAATQATALDPKYEDGPIALGIAFIAIGQKAHGVANLKKGFLLLADQKRADQLILENVEPNA
ncbi:MAG: tetratricopeptide repeat protein [Thermoleophilia bacterium]|nr:tetratricopeptide repeat protein [Thermoleophilia bacterium]